MSYLTEFWNAFVDNAAYLLSTVLPTSSGLPDDVSIAFTTFVAYLNGVNYLFPISTLFYILLLRVIYDNINLVFDFVKWIANLIRGSGA